MAQQPAKLEWREKTPFGLSASQFGMALGFLGKVSDYVDYQRNIVGTEQEFKGNAATAHGINTEAKARALYEMLTGIQVYDGGFYLSDERMLGCSPDGRSFYYESAGQGGCGRHTATPVPQTPRATASPVTAATIDRRSYSEADAGGCVNSLDVPRTSSSPKMKTTFSVRIPFNAGQRRQSSSSTELGSRCSVSLPTQRASSAKPSGSATTPAAPRSGLQAGAAPASAEIRPAPRYPRRRLRLLEIKSPFRALYDCGKELYHPFGIPQQYMCQMQGQMAIAGADECDFFIYLDAPLCQVEAWRVYRSRSFWDWAHPKLLQVVQWVRDGLPPHVNRSFAFEPFDFTTLTVAPLIYPFCISSGHPLEDVSRFAYFHRFASPFYEKGVRPGEASCGGDDTKPPGLMEPEAVEAIRSDAVKFLFVNNALSPGTLGCCVQATSSLNGPSTSELDTAVLPRAQESEEEEEEEKERCLCTAIFRAAAGKPPSVYEELLYRAVYQGRWDEDEREAEDPNLTGPLDGRQTTTLAKGSDISRRLLNARTLLGADIHVTTPEDWERGEVDVAFVIPATSTGECRKRTVRIRLFHREFFASLRLCEAGTAERTANGQSARAQDRPEQEVVAVPDSAAVTPRRSRATSVSQLVYIDVTPPAQAQQRERGPKLSEDDDGYRRPQEPEATTFVNGMGASVITVLAPTRRDLSEPLSQQVRLSLTPQRPRRSPERRATSPAAAHVIDSASSEASASGHDGVSGERAVPRTARSTADANGANTPGCLLVQEVDLDDVLLLVEDGRDCVKVVLVASPDSPVRTFWRDDDGFANQDGSPPGRPSDAARGDALSPSYELIVGKGSVLDDIARQRGSAKGAQGTVASTHWHRSVSSLAARLAESAAITNRDGATPQGGGPSPLRTVACYVEDTSTADTDDSQRGRARLAMTTPCFVLHTHDSEEVFRRVEECARRWIL